MATTATLMTMEQYLHTSFHPDVDFVDGELGERNLGERDHGRIQGLIFAWFFEREQQFGTFSIVEQRLRVANSRVRICDVTVLLASAPYEAVATVPPLICIEVLSPEDRLSRAEVVLKDYHAMGVPNIWLIDPIRHIAYCYTEAGLSVAANDVLRVDGTEIALDIKPLFEMLGRTNT